MKIFDNYIGSRSPREKQKIQSILVSYFNNYDKLKDFRVEFKNSSKDFELNKLKTIFTVIRDLFVRDNQAKIDFSGVGDVLDHSCSDPGFTKEKCIDQVITFLDSSFNLISVNRHDLENSEALKPEVESTSNLDNNTQVNAPSQILPGISNKHNLASNIDNTLEMAKGDGKSNENDDLEKLIKRADKSEQAIDKLTKLVEQLVVNNNSKNSDLCENEQSSQSAPTRSYSKVNRQKSKKKKRKSKSKRYDSSSTSDDTSESTSNTEDEEKKREELFTKRALVSKRRHPWLVFSLSIYSLKIQSIRSLSSQEIVHYIALYIKENHKNRKKEARVSAYIDFMSHLTGLKTLEKFSIDSIDEICQNTINDIDILLLESRSCDNAKVESTFQSNLFKYGVEKTTSSSFKNSITTKRRPFVRWCTKFNSNRECSENCKYSHICRLCYTLHDEKNNHMPKDCKYKGSKAANDVFFDKREGSR